MVQKCMNSELLLSCEKLWTSHANEATIQTSSSFDIDAILFEMDHQKRAEKLFFFCDAFLRIGKLIHRTPQSVKYSILSSTSESSAILENQNLKILMAPHKQ
ncbi:hypothetical protein TYRP_023146 [Tyrophagus putrescentiae]|nr:hypothetical protein TYRP_023146 [Tyrophagus putrescentiae]